MRDFRREAENRYLARQDTGCILQIVLGILFVGAVIWFCIGLGRNGMVLSQKTCSNNVSVTLLLGQPNLGPEDWFKMIVIRTAFDTQVLEGTTIATAHDSMGRFSDILDIISCDENGVMVKAILKDSSTNAVYQISWNGNVSEHK